MFTVGAALPLPLLLLLLLLLCCSAGAHASLSFRLDARDFTPWTDTKRPGPAYAMSNAQSAVCLLVGLDSGLGGVVRFAYSSSVTDVRDRADVLVSIHRPSASSPSMAALDATDTIIDTKIFDADQLHRTNVKADVVRRSKRNNGTPDVTAEEELAQSSTLTMRPVQDGQGPSAHFVDGSYAVCFLLVPHGADSGKKAAASAHEEVWVRLLEVASTRKSNLTYVARLGNPSGDKDNNDGNAQGADILAIEADREYAKMIRTLFRVNKNADLQSLLNANAVVSSEEMHQQLEGLKAVQEQLFSLYQSSEHLEDRYLRMRSTAETTFTRIWLCMIMTVVVMGTTIWLTFHFTKGIIVKRKLI